MDLVIKDINTLGQKDGYYSILDDKAIYKVKDEEKINICENTNAYVIDNSINKNIEINVSKNSNLKYIVLGSKNTKRVFNVLGNLNYVEISLDETSENLIVNLLDQDSKFEGKTLSIAKNYNTCFIQRVNHDNKKTDSNISNYGVAMSGATISFDTTGFIEKGNNKSNCRQLSRGVIMDNESNVTSKPILLINEFDCFANHGAAIGKMSDEDLFYLMSRGLTKNEAFLLILKGIIRPFIDELVLDELKNDIDLKVNELVYKEQ